MPALVTLGGGRLQNTGQHVGPTGAAAGMGAGEEAGEGQAVAPLLWARGPTCLHAENMCVGACSPPRGAGCEYFEVSGAEKWSKADLFSKSRWGRGETTEQNRKKEGVG